MKDYLSVKELSSLTGYKIQSIYNMIHKKTFILNQHYFKPTPKKILFKLTAVKQWIEGAEVSESHIQEMATKPAQANQKQNRNDSVNSTNKINI